MYVSGTKVGRATELLKPEKVIKQVEIRTIAASPFVMQSYPPRVLDRRLQEAWARATKEGPRVLMNLRVDF